MDDNCILEDIGYTTFEKILKIIGGKWKLRIIFMLASKGTLRYGELKRLIQPITHKMLASQLKELERDGLVSRQEFPQIPPKVEYSLTQMGRDLQPVVIELSNWTNLYEKNLNK